jgi:hypothetical protein
LLILLESVVKNRDELAVIIPSVDNNKEEIQDAYNSIDWGIFF